MWAREELQKKIERMLGEPALWRWNTNENSILSVTRQRAHPRYKISIHKMFQKAPKEFLPNLAAFIRKPTPPVRAAVRLFINSHDNDIKPKDWQDCAEAICPRGRVYDLAAMARRINRDYFKGQLRYHISWGRWGARNARLRSFSSIQLGSYNERRNLIRIHPILDTREVPEYFIAYIIYHEMCHIVCPPRMTPKGRVLYHSREFREIEKKYEKFGAALEYEKKRLPRLVTSRKNK